MPISRLYRPLGVVLAVIVCLFSLAAPAAAAPQDATPESKPLLAIGTGSVTSELPFCFNGRPGPCGWIVEGRTAGTPIRSGTFFAAIDNGGENSPRRCLPATSTGLLRTTSGDEIVHVATGRVCPQGAGGYVFSGRFDVGSGTGRFADVSSGGGRVIVTVSSRGSASLLLAGNLRIG